MSSLQTEIKKKVTGYLFFSPWNLVPLVGGFTLLIATWANDGPSWLGMGGLLGVIGAVGMGVSRFLLGLDALYQKAWSEIQDETKKKETKHLLDLHEKLALEHDKRTTSALLELVSVYDDFQKKVANAEYSVPAKSEITGKVKVLFDACLKKLEEQHGLWESKKSVPTSTGRKKTTPDKREKAIEEIQASIQSMSGSIDGCMEMADNAHGDLSSIRRDLETSMRVAKRTDERMAEMGLKERTLE